jgi:hypothetical protein
MYKNLKPGLYLQMGDSVKSLTLNSPDGWQNILGRGRTPSAETLAAEVSWVFIALDRIKQAVSEIPIQWQVKGQDVDELPLDWDYWDDLPRIYESLKLYGYAALRKYRGRGRLANTAVTIRWLDPAALTPNETTASAIDGYQDFLYSTDKGQIRLAREEVIFIASKGMREVKPGSPAAAASSLAAQVIHSMDSTADTFFDTNALPPMLVTVPATTQENDRKRIESRFRRIFQARRNDSGNKTIGVSDGVKVEKLSFAPEQWALTAIEDGKKDAILLSYGVHPAIVYKDVNLAEAREKMKQFISQVGGQLERVIARNINNDPDMQRLGIQLIVNTQQHPSQAQDENQLSQAFVNYLQGMTPQAAAYRVGITYEDFPDELQGEIFKQSSMDPEPPTMPPTMPPPPPDPDDTEAKAADLRKLRKYVSKGRHKKRPFLSDVLTADEIKAAITEWEDGSAEDAPFQGSRKFYN